MKAQLLAAARREQITESMLVRQLVESMLRVQVDSPLPKVGSHEVSCREARFSVRLDGEDHLALKRQARERRMPAAT